MPTPHDTIEYDVSEDSGVEAFLSNLTGDDPRKKTSTEDEVGGAKTPEVDTPESDNTPAEKTEGDDEGEQETDPDDAEVEIKVGEETKKATLKELKRLYGQEASLTQKSQALAQQRAAADATYTQAHTALQTMSQRAAEAYRPYAELDWLVVAQNMDTETFKSLRQDAAAAEANVKFYEHELQQTVAKHQEQAQLAHREAVAECVKAMESPETGIPGFGKPMYDEMIGFAKEQGFDQAHLITKPAVLKMLHMAMAWSKQQSATKVAEAKIAKAPNKPTTVLKPGSKSNTDSTSMRSAMQKLRQTGSLDDATDAFMASFKA
jgi:hypothetical protein